MIERTRKEIPEISLRAITEALVNSLCHRDYIAPESNKIAIIYKDRIDIWNPGEFAYGYSPEDFIKRELHSILRNPMIAHCLFLSADIEKWGSGLKRIEEECSGKVEFKILKFGYSVVFKRNVTVNASVTLSDLQNRILIEIEKNSTLTYDNLSTMLQKDRETIRRNIQKLKKCGKLERIGPDKGGYWKILK